MIIEMRNDLVDFLESLKVEGGLMEGWKTIRPGVGHPDIDGDFPLLQVKWAGGAPPDFAHGGLAVGSNVSIDYLLTGYVSDTPLDDVAGACLASLYWSEDGTKGLHLALGELVTGDYEMAGRVWLWTVGQVRVIEPRPTDRWSEGFQVVVTATSTV